MRGSITIATVCLALGCTAPNPEFGSTGTTDAMTDATASSSATATTTTDPVGEATTTPTTAEGGSTSTAADESTTGALDRHCCSDQDCAGSIRECLCDFPPELGCCDMAWGTNCPALAIACGGVCMGETRPCCTPHETPACTGIIMETTAFCLTHSECCLVAWTPACVVLYDIETGNCGLGSCEVPHATPGCEDPSVMECVCGQQNLPQCCEVEWHQDCAVAAAAC